MAKKNILAHMRKKPQSFDSKFNTSESPEVLAEKVQNEIAGVKPSKNNKQAHVEETETKPIEESPKTVVEVLEKAKEPVIAKEATNDNSEREVKSKEVKKLEKIVSTPKPQGPSTVINLSLKSESRKKFLKLSNLLNDKNDTELEKYDVLRSVLYDFLDENYDKLLEKLQ